MMKKKSYTSPEFEVALLKLEAIMAVSDPEHGRRTGDDPDEPPEF